jgi:uncharacterized protein (TIGR02246 family)
MTYRAKLVVGRTLGVALVVGMAGFGPLIAQATPDAEFKKIADAFSQAWAKGDAKGIAALHSTEAVRVMGTGEPAVNGRAAIEQSLTTALTGPYKGTTLKITSNAYRKVTEDTYIGEGTYEVAGGSPPPGTPMRGQYMNTMVRQGGRWLIAASAVMPAMPAMPAK